MSVLRLRHAVAVPAGRFPALAGVDLEVAAGEVVLLQGPNGAGKTTLLRVCAGLVPLQRGEGEVLGFDLARDRRSVRRNVGLIGHAAFLYDDLTAWENVRFWCRASGVDEASAEGAMVRLGVDGRLRDLAVGAMSAGQRRRVSIAAMVARRPMLWLLDEPHAGLDQEGRDVVDRLVLDAAAAGATVLVASHELDRTRSLAPRVVTIAGGVVVHDTAVPARSAAGVASGA